MANRPNHGQGHSHSQSHCCGANKVKVITVFCLLALVANYVAFLHYKKEMPRFNLLETWVRSSNNTSQISDIEFAAPPSGVVAMKQIPDDYSKDSLTTPKPPEFDLQKDGEGDFSETGGNARQSEGSREEEEQDKYGESTLANGLSKSLAAPTAQTGDTSSKDSDVTGDTEVRDEKSRKVSKSNVKDKEVNRGKSVIDELIDTESESDQFKDQWAESDKTNNKTSAIQDKVRDTDGNNNNLDPSKSAAATQKPPPPLPVCPDKPKELVGNIKTYLNPIGISKVEAKYPEVTKGGNYHPEDCRPPQKLALVIPCRNRTSHLHILLNNLLPTLIKQKLDFTIFVIDQDLPTTFNRGMLFNAGYLEALKKGNYTCFIFHDVDMVPTNDNCLYKCSHNPRHFLSGLSKWNYGLAYIGYYGGVVSFTKDQFKKINGASNLYFGWGGEDDDLRMRVLNKGYNVVRYPKYIGRYDTVSHKRDKGNEANEARFELNKWAKRRQDREGLNTAKYKVTEVVEEKLFTKIKVYINEKEILEEGKQFAPSAARYFHPQPRQVVNGVFSKIKSFLG